MSLSITRAPWTDSDDRLLYNLCTKYTTKNGQVDWDHVVESWPPHATERTRSAICSRWSRVKDLIAEEFEEDNMHISRRKRRLPNPTGPPSKRRREDLNESDDEVLRTMNSRQHTTTLPNLLPDDRLPRSAPSGQALNSLPFRLTHSPSPSSLDSNGDQRKHLFTIQNTPNPDFALLPPHASRVSSTGMQPSNSSTPHENGFDFRKNLSRPSFDTQQPSINPSDYPTPLSQMDVVSEIMGTFADCGESLERQLSTAKQELLHKSEQLEWTQQQYKQSQEREKHWRQRCEEVERSRKELETTLANLPIEQLNMRLQKIEDIKELFDNEKKRIEIASKERTQKVTNETKKWYEDNQRIIKKVVAEKNQHLKQIDELRAEANKWRTISQTLVNRLRTMSIASTDFSKLGPVPDIFVGDFQNIDALAHTMLALQKLFVFRAPSANEPWKQYCPALLTHISSRCQSASALHQAQQQALQATLRAKQQQMLPALPSQSQMMNSNGNGAPPAPFSGSGTPGHREPSM